MAGGALEQTTRDLATVIETMNCGLVARDLHGNVVFINETLLRWLDYERHEILGRRVEELAPPELREPMVEEMKSTNEGDIRPRLAVIQRKDTTTFPIVVIPQRFFDEQGRAEGSFALIVDLGAVTTAKPVRYRDGDVMRESLDQIAVQLHILGLTADLPASAPVLLSHPDLRELSPREQEVLMHLVAGDRVPGISKQLHISPHTVRNHLKSIYRKLGVSTQSDLIQKVRGLADAQEPSQEAPSGEDREIGPR